MGDRQRHRDRRRDAVAVLGDDVDDLRRIEAVELERLQGRARGLVRHHQIDVVRRDVPTCRLKDRVGEVYRHCQDIGWKVCLVVTESNVVLGRLRREAWAANPQTPVEEVMENGPTTFRPDNFLEPLVQRMQEKKVGSVIVTNSDGVLLGILFRKDAEEQLHQNRLMRGL